MTATLRDQYVIGCLGSYLVPTVERCDAEIVKLTARIAPATGAARERVLDDIDKLLERRLRLMETQ